jgi:hypothetical protein
MAAGAPVECDCVGFCVIRHSGEGTNEMGTPVSAACSAVVFYGISLTAEAAESFYRALVDWFKELGYPPTRVGVTGGPADGRGKMASYARVEAKLGKAGFEGVEGFTIDTLPAKSTTFEYAVVGGCRTGIGDVAWMIARSSLADLFPTSMLPLAFKVARELNPCYGVGFRQDGLLGPKECYVNVVPWNHGGQWQAYNDGFLRDVYPWNFVSAFQLQVRVEGRTLEEWIHADPNRGRVSDFLGSLKLWEVEDDRQPAVRRRLQEANVVFDKDRYLARYDPESVQPRAEFLAALRAGQTKEELLALLHQHSAAGLPVLYCKRYVEDLLGWTNRSRTLDLGPPLTADEVARARYVCSWAGRTPPSEVLKQRERNAEKQEGKADRERRKAEREQLAQTVQENPPITPVFEVDEQSGKVKKLPAKKVQRMLKGRTRKQR